MAGTLVATGLVPKWEDYDLHTIPRDRGTIDGRVPKYTSLTNNLTRMMTSVYNLHQNPAYAPSFINESVVLARRLTWIMLYFQGAMSHFSSWILGQTEVNSVAQRNVQVWTDFLQSLNDLVAVLASLPADWAAQGIAAIQNNTTLEQTIPAEAPLELVAQTYLNVHDAVNPLNTPDLVQATLRQVAVANNFPAGYDPNNHDGFSNCIFVTQSDPPNRALIAGSTVLYIGYLNVPVLTARFTALRQLRFTQGVIQYDTELRARFRNQPDTELTTPERRYLAVGWQRNSFGLGLAGFVDLVRDRLRDEYAGLQPAPVAADQVPGPVLLPGERKVWASFSYAEQHARSNFAPRAHANQQNWFEPTPRCMKCRVIHNYNIVGEDLQVRATANKSCQCAEDIVYGKLRELNRVGNVVLADL